MEQHHTQIVDGAFADALDLCRRLLRAEDSAQRVETAHLILDRLRGNKCDSDDDVNTLLRLLANFVSPTRELTEDALSLLFCCDHRVLVIHHLSKLTYQSTECVKLVVEAYLELLASDRSLLVPILGSLADLPLDTADKSAVLDATECLLDAAVEDDVPAVVQSLLSMVSPSTASRIAAKLRTECNRIESSTLCLTLEVIGRFAVARSNILTSLLRLIRQADALTPFDVLLLTHLMGKATENAIAIKTSSYLVHRGRFQRLVLCETLATLAQPEWRTLLPSFLRFSSFLLASCFQDLTKLTVANRLIPLAVDCIGALVGARTAVHEEALTLLFTLSSQPKKLLLLATSRTAQRTHGTLCWKIAEAVASQLAALATHRSRVLAPYAHLFLDHLHAIASTTTSDDRVGSYPAHILDLLCRTMVALTQQERGVLSLLMITIQKQLVVRGAAGVASQSLYRSTNTTNASATQVKQLIALFLAGNLLKSDVARDVRDRKSLVLWLLRLLSTAASDETLLHAMRIVQDGMTSADAPFLTTTASCDDERTQCATLMAQVFRKKSLTLREPADVRAHNAVVFSGHSASRPPSSLVADLVEFAHKMQLDAFAAYKLKRVETARDVSGANSAAEAIDTFADRVNATKLTLLQQLFRSFVAFAPATRRNCVLDCSFALPPQHALLCSGTSDVYTKASATLEPRALGDVIWILVCSLDVAVTSANAIATEIVQDADADATSDRHNRLVARVTLCLDLRTELERAIAVQRQMLQRCKDDDPLSNSSTVDIEWLTCQCSAAERLMRGESARNAEDLRSASLCGLELHTLCLVFATLSESRKTSDALGIDHELALLRVLSFHLRADASESASATESLVNASASSDGRVGASASEFQNAQLLSHEGKQTLEYLSTRASALSDVVNAATTSTATSCGSSNDDAIDADAASESDDGDDNDDNTYVQATRSLLCIYSLFVLILECGDDSDASASATWTAAIVERFAAGCRCDVTSSDDDDSDDARTHVEVFYKFLLQETLKSKHPQLACALVDVLAVLTARTRKQAAISRLCMLMLQHPFPSGRSNSSAMLSVRSDENARVLGDALPVQSLPLAVVALRGASQCSLAKYRCSSTKWRHVAFLVVGSWVFASSASNRAAVLGYYLDAMHSVVASVAQQQTDARDKRRRERRRRAKATTTASDDDDAAPSIEVAMASPPAAVVHDGEHLVLASLTIDTFPFFYDTALMCCIASLASAAPRTSRAGGTNNSTTTAAATTTERDMSPFRDLCDALAVTHNALLLYVRAERTGFDLPTKTASHVLKLVKQLLQQCIAWRVEQVGDDPSGALHHLEVLFESVERLLEAMGRVLSSFQERVALTMQQSRRLVTKRSDADSASGKGKNRWQHPLLAQLYGKTLRKRRGVSKTESKLLPYFAHGIDELRDFVEHQSAVNNLELADPDEDRDGNDSAWLPLGPSVDTDFFLRSGAVVQDELIHGSLSDWDRDSHWTWNGKEDDDDVEEEEEERNEQDENGDDRSSDDRSGDEDGDATQVDDDAAADESAAPITHTPQVRRKSRTTSNSASTSSSSKRNASMRSLLYDNDDMDDDIDADLLRALTRKRQRGIERQEDTRLR